MQRAADAGGFKDDDFVGGHISCVSALCITNISQKEYIKKSRTYAQLRASGGGVAIQSFQWRHFWIASCFVPRSRNDG
jgi:hypothetical protein